MVAKTSKLELSNGDFAYIPLGYLSDYASIPFLLKFFLNHIGSYRSSFVMHDFLYHYKGYFTDPKLTQFTAVSRIQADKEMKSLMIKYGSSKLRANLYYLAVRLFGWLSYGRI